MDRARQHTAETARGFIGGNPDVRVTWLPTTTPETNAVGEYWHLTRRNVPVSEYYGVFMQMRRTLSEHLRTVRRGPSVMKFIYRKLLNAKNF